MQLTDNDTLLFIGDSITDCGRERPAGYRNGLGNGYVAQINALLGALHPQQRVRVINVGTSGNRVIDLKARWQTDVLDLKPDWVSIKIGINDVWRRFDDPTNPVQVDDAQFAAVYRELINATLPKVKGIVLVTPYFLETNAAEPMRAQMDRLSAIVKELGKEFKLPVVDTQAAFDAFLKERHYMELCSDRVHPNLTGHAILALTWLRALGLDS